MWGISNSILSDIALRKRSAIFHPANTSPLYAPLNLYLNLSNSPKSTTRNSRLAHIITPSMKPGTYPPPIIIPSLHALRCASSSIARIMHTAPLAGMRYRRTRSLVSGERYGSGVDDVVERYDGEGEDARWPVASRDMDFPFAVERLDAVVERVGVVSAGTAGRGR